MRVAEVCELAMSFHARRTGSESILGIGERLSALPGLVQVSAGTRLGYMTGMADGSKARLRVDAERISIDFHYDGRLGTKGTAMSQLLSVLAFLKEDCRVDFGSLYPQLACILLEISDIGAPRGDAVRVERLETQASLLAASNEALSAEICRSEQAILSLSSMCKTYGKFCSAVFRYVDSALTHRDSRPDIMERIGIDRDLAERVGRLVNESENGGQR